MTAECRHGSDPLACPVASCNPRGAHDWTDPETDDLEDQPWRTLVARHDGHCAVDCGDRIEPGDPIVWRPGEAAHSSCRTDLEGAA